MSRKRIQIDAEKCAGCGLCAKTCQQSAIAMVDGKAKVVRDDYCDGIGNCLPVCPVGAISFSDRDIAPKPSAQPVAAPTAPASTAPTANKVPRCPSSMAATLPPAQSTCPSSMAAALPTAQNSAANPTAPHISAATPSQLRQWPVQIKLVPANAPYFNGAHLLIAADCAAYAYGNFHRDFMQNRITLIGCPKLDAIDYTEKLTQIIAQNNIASLTVARMQVPCCGGIERAAVQAVKGSGKTLPLTVKTISVQGALLD